ncbi:MAG: MFS transporter [Acidimicrobiales bacterium]
MRVGFIGLGTMGSRMAGNILAAGHQLVVHDLNPAAGEPLLERGASWAVSPAAVAGQVDVVFTSLPGPPQVEAVALSLNGIIGGALPGLAYFDLSTNSPTVMRRIHAEMTPRGVHVFDAPVSGGPDGAASGRLAIWAGGDPDAFDAFLPVLRSFSDAPHLVGPIGAGSIAKLVHNCSGYILQTALAETFTLGVKAGVDPEALWEAVRMGALGRRRTFDTLSRNFLPGRFDPPDFALELARKDVALAVELAREYDVPMRLANLTLMEMTEAMNRGWAKRDSRSAMLLQEERTGVEVRIATERIAEIVDGGRRQPDPVAEAEVSQSWFDRTIGRMRGKAATPIPATETSPSLAASAPVRPEAREAKPPSLLDHARGPEGVPASEKPPSLLDSGADGGPAAAGYYLAPGHIEPVKPPSLLDQQRAPEPVKPPSLLDTDQPIGLDADLGLIADPTVTGPVPASDGPGDDQMGPDDGTAPGSPGAAPQSAAATPTVETVGGVEPVKPPSIIDDLLDEILENPPPGSPIAGNGSAAAFIADPGTSLAGGDPGTGPAAAPSPADGVMIFPADAHGAAGTATLQPGANLPFGATTTAEIPANTAVAAVVAAPALATAPGDPSGIDDRDHLAPADEAGVPPAAPGGLFYGWVIVGAVFIILMVGSGLGFYNASVILSFAHDELGASLGAVSGGPATFFGISGIVGFLLARRMDKVDLRWFYLAGGALGALALYGLRWVDSILTYYLFFALFGVAFSVCGLVPSITLVTRWFDARRKTAISITSTGLSLGGIVLTPVAKDLIKTHQLGGAGPIMALIWIVGIVPLGILLIRSFPYEKGVGPDGTPLGAMTAGKPSSPAVLAGATFVDARRNRFFLMLCLAYALIFFSQVGGLAHLFNLAKERSGDRAGSLALALLAGTSVVGRLLGGLIVLRVPTKVFSMILVILQAAALACISVSNSSIAIVGSAVFLGVSVGNLLMLQPLLLAEAYGVREYAQIYGFNQLIGTIGVASGPFVLGFVHDGSSYTVAFVVAAIGSVLGFLAFLAAGPITGPLHLWGNTPVVARAAATPAASTDRLMPAGAAAPLVITAD